MRVKTDGDKIQKETERQRKKQKLIIICIALQAFMKNLYLPNII